MSEIAALQDLERKLEELDVGVAGGRPDAAGDAVPTGVPPLDALLPRGGLPRGEGVEWLGPRSCGKTAFLRATLRRLRSTGEPVALVDAGRTLHAPDWEELEEGEGLFWVVRPPSEEAAWCADLLLRSGAFGAVALVFGEGDGGEGSASRAGRSEGTARGGRPGGGDLRRGVAVRLQRLAEEAGAVFVATRRLPVASLRLRFRPGRVEPVRAGPFGPFLPPVRPVWVRVGEGRAAEVPVLCPGPPDRTLSRPARDRKGRR